MRDFRLPLLLLSLGLLGTPQGIPASQTLEKWAAHQESSRKQLNHAAWKELLGKYLDTTAADGIHRLRYGKVAKADREALEAYLARLQAEPVSALNKAEQRAFWINLYNAKTVSVVLGRYPVASIRAINLSKETGKSGPWDAKILRVEGVDLSLNDIENRILRPLWKDARIHFALNCASLGCPNLAPVPYTAANSEALLDHGVRVFIRSRQGVSFQGKTLVISSIFDWYREDFGSERDKVIAYLSGFSEPGIREKLRDYPGELKYQYDWSLNDATPKP